ncbi:Outer membrane receptor for ferrienterochelin and colicins [Sphingobacterium spiritivorum]|uniref:Outer membrane receptor for ferrienterochelin and colicins n=1 Tax=Sphingobacterium spiritivorum TaxID=258 RepID=A0A380BXH2_SPHSI|nr:TonB-dependent receptor [Sphingobacterium spiritivorum]SUJ07866.1 Outer membrane receptor for ferrienterochelin and colicins [Sphingobacterium spiritivorum]
MNTTIYYRLKKAIIFLFFLSSVICMPAARGQQNLQLHFQNKPLKEIFLSIEQQTGYSFLFDENVVNVNRKTSLKASGSLSGILEQLENTTYLDFQISGKNILVKRAGVARLSGKVQDEKGEPLSSVSVFLREFNQYFFTDKDGQFAFNYPTSRAQEVHLSFTMLGRQAQQKQVTLRASDIQLPPTILPVLSVGLEEISINPKVNQNLQSNSSLFIDREVIEQSGALSLNDLLNLIPGQKIAPPSLQQVQQATLRSSVLQTNSASTRDPFSLNSSFGVAIIMDGIAISNNANMQTRNPGISGMGESYVNGFISSLKGSADRLSRYTGDYTFGGTDLRQIATDNIENVEIVAGVPSVRYGDMTDGAIIVNRIAGKTPLNFSMQLRDNATSYGLSKGFSTKKIGSFSFGANFIRSFMDNRDKLKSYDRLGTNMMWSTAAGKERAFTNTFSVDYGRNLDNIRRDADDPTGTFIKFRSYNFSVGNRSNYRIENSFITNIGLNLRYSQNYQNTYQEQEKNELFTIYTDATEPGITKGIYGPGIYTAITNIEGKPVDFSSRLDLTGQFKTGDIEHQLNFGASYNYSKNNGKGQIIDPSRPRNNTTTANADNRSERYYDFSRIHAQNNFGLYAEDVFRAKIADRNLNVRAGLRMDVFEGYSTFSPRSNVNYEILPNLRLGAAFGWSSKAPALAQLYPGPVFYEIPLFQKTAVTPTGSIDEANSLYLLYVDKYTPDNANLKPSTSRQIELSLLYELKEFNISMNVYKKNTDRGITTISEIERITLPQYINNPDPGAELPYLISGSKNYSLSRNLFVNGNRTESRGVELLLSTPKWKAIQTSFNLRGGYVETSYNPIQSRRSFTNPTTNTEYATIGIYPALKRITSSSNAALTSSTHIPKAKLLVNFIAEFNLLRRTNTEASDGVPTGYYTEDGRYFAIENFDLSNINYGHLQIPAAEVRNENQPGVYTNFHLNLSKEISKRLTLAFNVYNVFNYRPQFKRADNSMVIPNGKPTYGAQLRLKL